MRMSRRLPWILSALLLVGASSQLNARPEEVRESRDELDEELGELGEEDAESAVLSIATRADYDTWRGLTTDIAAVYATGTDPLKDPVLVQKIRQSGDPRVFSAINNRMEEAAHARRQGGLVEVLPVTGAVFEALGTSGTSASLAPQLKTGGSVLSGALFLLFGLRVIGRGRKPS